MKSTNCEEYVYRAVLDGELEIDSEGRVWRLACRRGKPGGTRLIPCERRRADGPEGKNQEYLAVRVMYNYVRYQCRAHRLVYLHFKGKIPDGLTINHENGIKKDNRPSNLEPATYSEQILHAIHVLGTHRSANQSGENSSTSKLKNEDVLEIRRRRRNGETLTSIASDFGICFQSVSQISLGKSWKHLEAIK